jgi:hypothetical protein
MSDTDYITECERATLGITDALKADNVGEAMAQLARANRALCNLAPLLVEQGVRRGMSQRQMARFLDVPESTLRGARREFAA